MKTPAWFICLLTLLIAMPLIAVSETANKKAQLKQLFANEWEYELRESPELATSIGDYRYNDRWSDSSLAHVQVQKRDLQAGWTNLRSSTPRDSTSRTRSACS